MKTLARLTSLTVFCVVAFQWWEGDRSWELVTLGAVSAVVVFWSCGGFDRGVWVGSPEVDAECARLDAELDAADVVYPERGTA